MRNYFNKEFSRYKWRTWPYKPGHFEDLKNDCEPIPPEHGVYIIKSSKNIPRVRRKSAVIYIGQSGGGKRGGKQGIGKGNNRPGRLFNTRGLDKCVREKIESMSANKEDFSVICHFTNKGEDPKDIENKLLTAYLKTYYELPPGNHQAPKLK